LSRVALNLAALNLEAWFVVNRLSCSVTAKTFGSVLSQVNNTVGQANRGTRKSSCDSALGGMFVADGVPTARRDA
jgi:hypothetical protein